MCAFNTYIAYITAADYGCYSSDIGIYCYNAGTVCKSLHDTNSLSYERCKRLKKAEKKVSSFILVTKAKK